jgi:hypothetical protein
MDEIQKNIDKLEKAKKLLAREESEKKALEEKISQNKAN